MRTCIYCGESNKKFCKAHILPRSLGKFQNQPTLLEKVCAECDTEIGKSEDQFTHNGFAALLRPLLGLSLDKKRSPFRRRFAGQGPIEMQTEYLGLEDVLFEPDGIGDAILPPTMPLPQLHFIYANGENKRIRIQPETLTSEDILKIIRNNMPKQIIAYGLNDDELERIWDICRQAGISISEEIPIRLSSTQSVIPIKVKGRFTCDQRFFQAIAKIAFHYYLGMNLEYCYHNGSESIFNPLRQFIRYGKGNPELFVTQKNGYFVDDFLNGWRPQFYGHLFVLDLCNKNIIVKVQFFVGPNINLPYYEVLLCENPFIINIQPRKTGHNYSYIEPNKRKQYAGTIHKLGVNNFIILPNKTQSI
ncbi:MAG: hypothetical protein JXA96_09330 [Sedimentisphaerales bacterium]|nr:hypothetical protein [Sedimentisphaerales bacterium]